MRRLFAYIWITTMIYLMLVPTVRVNEGARTHWCGQVWNPPEYADWCEPALDAQWVLIAGWTAGGAAGWAFAVWRDQSNQRDAAHTASNPNAA